MHNFCKFIKRCFNTGEELIVTNNNVPTLKVIPIKEKMSVEDVFGDLRGKVRLDDSIMKPETDEWGV